MIINRKSGGRSQSPALCVSCKIGASFVLPLAFVGIHFWGSYKKVKKPRRGVGGECQVRCAAKVERKMAQPRKRRAVGK